MAGRYSVEAVFKAVDRMSAPVSRMQNRIGKFTRSAERNMKSLQRVTGKLTGGIKKLAGVGFKAAAVGAAALGGAIGYVIKQYAKVANAEASFTPLLGSAAKAAELTEKLNKLGAATPFDFEGLSGVALQLLPVMNGEIDRTIELTRMLGDTAGGNLQKLETITRGYTKAMLKGKVDMESLNMIGEAGVPILTELAKTMGVEVNDAFFKMISAGKVATTDLTKTFERMTSKGGIFFRGMEIASKTTTGLWSTFMDVFGQTAAKVGKIIDPIVQSVIQSMTGATQTAQDWIAANEGLIKQKIEETVAAIVDKVKQFVAWVKKLDAEQSIFDRIGNALKAILGFMAFLAKHGKTIAIIAGGIVALNAVLGLFIGIMTAVNLVMALNPIGLIVIGVAALVLGFTALYKWAGSVEGAFRKWAGAMDYVLDRINPVYMLIKKVIEGIKFVANADINPFNNRQESSQRERGAVRPQVVSPTAGIERKISESTTTNKSEVTIKDQTGKAEVTKRGGGARLSLQPSGAF